MQSGQLLGGNGYYPHPYMIIQLTITQGWPSRIQRGPVWFLAGTTEGIANRECIIPANKSILYPVLNFGATLADEPTLKTEQELIALARREMDRISNLEIKVDGEKISDIQNYRIQSPVFDIVLPENNLFGGLAGPTRGVSEGYWLFLKGLPKGNHRIQSLGSCLAGQLTIGANYDSNCTIARGLVSRRLN